MMSHIFFNFSFHLCVIFLLCFFMNVYFFCYVFVFYCTRCDAFYIYHTIVIHNIKKKKIKLFGAFCCMERTDAFYVINTSVICI
jgi:hypothetical protein